MRHFDYTQIPDSLRSDELASLLLAVREFKGCQVTLNTVKPAMLCLIDLNYIAFT